MSTFTRRDPAQLQAQLQQLKSKNGFTDEKLWKPTLDAAGNGEALIRFIAAGDEVPFVKLINHSFKKNGKSYYANCTSTHNDYASCPVCEHLNANDSFNKNKPEYDLLKRKHQYWANILVIKDPAAPENEGKVFKYRFGQKIMDKINAMAEVNTAMGEIPVDVFCPFEGANFIMKIKKVSGFSNYDESKFLGKSEIANINDPAFQKELFEGMTNLKELISADKFDSYDKNKEKFKKVMGTSIMGGNAQAAANNASSIDNELETFSQELENFNSGVGAQQSDLESVFSSQKAGIDTGSELEDILNQLP